LRLTPTLPGSSVSSSLRTTRQADRSESSHWESHGSSASSPRNHHSCVSVGHMEGQMKHVARRQSPASIVRLLLFAIGLLPFAAPVTAGQGAAAPASIVGQITDGTGAVLPGVTVTATSPALQVPSVTTVTDERGDYRLSPLPIGVYTVSYELAGFQMLRREGVRLTVGFAARVDQVMNLGAVSESITVSGASPLVDTTSTATRTELTQEQLDVLPTSRDGLK